MLDFTLKPGRPQGEQGAMLNLVSRTCDLMLACLQPSAPVHLSPSSSSHGLWVFLLAMLLVGCVSTRVEYFVDPPYPARELETPISWLSSEPREPHIELARITVGSANVSEDILRQRVLDRARSLGADAVVTEGTAAVASFPNRARAAC